MYFKMANNPILFSEGKLQFVDCFHCINVGSAYFLSISDNSPHASLLALKLLPADHFFQYYVFIDKLFELKSNKEIRCLGYLYIKHDYYWNLIFWLVKGRNEMGKERVLVFLSNGGFGNQPTTKTINMSRGSREIKKE